MITKAFLVRFEELLKDFAWDCGCLLPMDAEECGGQLDCGSGGKRGTHPCDCFCHQMFDWLNMAKDRVKQ